MCFFFFMPYNYGMLRQKLQEEQIAALKNKEGEKLEVLRFVIAKIKNQEIEKKAELSDEETLIILQKIKKELQETIDAAQKGGRSDLVEANQKQLAILQVYLPKELTDEQIEVQIKELVVQNQEAMQANPKAIIGVVMKALRGKADPSRIMPILQKHTQS